jgi:glycosyltransferase involved in cell wall biosynthesis
VAEHAQVIVCHDSENPDYVYDLVGPSFRFAATDTRFTPWTTILSNYMPLDDLGMPQNEYLCMGNQWVTNNGKRILIGVPVKNCAQYLERFAYQLAYQEYFDHANITVVFLENDSDDNSYEECQKAASILIANRYKATVLKHDFGFKCPHTSRHRPEVQGTRLKCIAAARQMIVDKFLEGHDYVCWLDADFETIPPYTLARLAASGRDITIPVYYTQVGETQHIYDGTSYRLVDGKMQGVADIIKQYPEYVVVALDHANAAAMIHRRVFEKANYNNIDDDQEGGYMSRQARAHGFTMALCTGAKVRHACVDGMQPPA